MDINQELEKAQRVYKDILNGYSEIPHFKITGAKIFIKHLSDMDHGWMKEYKNEIYYEAKTAGLFTEKEKLESLREQGLWSAEKDALLEENRITLGRLIETRGKLIIKKQKEQVQQLIDKKEGETIKLDEEKSSLMGVTCESHASKKVNERYLFQVSFKDKELTEGLWTEEEFEEVTEIELTSLITINNIKMQDYTEDSVRRVSAAPFFLNSLMLCKDNPFTFFGKPIVELSNYQTELFSNGTRYKNIIEKKGKIPPPLSTLSESVKFYEDALTSQISGDESKDNLGTATSIMGADAEEMRKLAESEGGKNVVDLASQSSKIMKEKGTKKLTMQDMMKIHGE